MRSILTDASAFLFIYRTTLTLVRRHSLFESIAG
jgi:hypothetical protein